MALSCHWFFSGLRALQRLPLKFQHGPFQSPECQPPWWILFVSQAKYLPTELHTVDSGLFDIHKNIFTWLFVEQMCAPFTLALFISPFWDRSVCTRKQVVVTCPWKSELLEGHSWGSRSGWQTGGHAGIGGHWDFCATSQRKIQLRRGYEEAQPSHPFRGRNDRGMGGW